MRSRHTAIAAAPPVPVRTRCRGQATVTEKQRARDASQVILVRIQQVATDRPGCYRPDLGHWANIVIDERRLERRMTGWGAVARGLRIFSDIGRGE